LSSDSDFAGFYLNILAGAIIMSAAGLALLVAPLIGLAAVPAVLLISYRNSPQYKEKKAKQYTYSLLREAMYVAPPDIDTIVDRFIKELPNETVGSVACDIYVLEGYDTPPDPPPICNSVEGARYRDRLLAYISNAQSRENVDAFIDQLIRCLPKYEPEGGLFEATAELTPNEIERLILPFYETDDFFHSLKRLLDRNFREQKNVLPSQYTGDNCAFLYLKDTPLRKLATRQIPVGLTNRTSHMHLVGGSGHGKTSCIQHMIAADLEDDCTVIVIDNQRQMIPKLAKLDLPLDEVTFISPRHNLGINLFDVRYQELKNSEEAVNSTVELLEYVLSALMGAELTPKQQLIFQYAIQLTIAIPGANIRTFLDILKPKGWQEYAGVIDTLPDVVRDFFHREFDDEKQFGSTKKEIAWRIWGIMKNPSFARIFSARTNPVRMEAEMAERRLILIDTDINRLGEDGSSFLGRLFIALILQAARRRFEQPERPVYLYIDEAPIYFDKNLATMLEMARKANIGLILAHQELEQARAKGLLSSLIGNTAIKFAGGLSDTDARYMAGNMSCDYQFIKEQKPLHFAAHIKGQGTYSVRVPVGVIEDMDQRVDLDELVKKMDETYGYQPVTEQDQTPDGTAGDEPVSTKGEIAGQMPDSQPKTPPKPEAEIQPSRDL